jgi:hypothetical protein
MANFTDISPKFDSLIRGGLKEECVTISNKHHIFALITRIGSFKTKMSIKLASVSKSGITFRSACDTLFKSSDKNVMVELYVNGKLLTHKASIVSHDVINELHEIRFTQPVEYIDEYLSNFNTAPHYGLNAPPASNGSMSLGMIV